MMGKAIAFIVLIFGVGFLGWFIYEKRSNFDEPAVITPVVTDQYLVARETDPFKGKIDAPVTLIMAGSFTCPTCRTSAEVVDQVLAIYPNELKVIWKDAPEQAGTSFTASVAARCAQRQGEFWDYHDRLFRKQDVLASSAQYIQWAKDLGLREGEFATCMNDTGAKALVQQSVNDVLRTGIEAVPYFQINSTEVIKGGVTVSQLRSIIDNLLSQR